MVPREEETFIAVVHELARNFGHHGGSRGSAQRASDTSGTTKV